MNTDLSTLGPLMAAGLALGMTGLGIAATLAPGPVSRFYGVPQTDADGHAWVRAAGLRDLALAGVLAVLLAGDGTGLAAICFATAFIALTDVFNVLHTRGVQPLPLAVHASGVGAGILAGLLLL